MPASHLVVCDLEGTLLGESNATKRFKTWWTLNGADKRLVYASSRDYERAVSSFTSAHLPDPDAVISEVGTEIRLYPNALVMMEWSSRWWSRWTREGVERVLSESSQLQLPDPTDQSDFRLSYVIENLTERWLHEARTFLMSRRVWADLIYSANRELDVVPVGANKGAAAEFLALKWGIARQRVLVAGDSGNDLSLFLHGFRGVIVGNAQPELAYLTGTNVYRSQLHHADGVIDGLSFWLGTP